MTGRWLSGCGTFRAAQGKNDGGERRKFLGRRLPFDYREQGFRRGWCVSERAVGDHSGMFPCFLVGRLARLSRRARRPLMICARVSDGAMTAST